MTNKEADKLLEIISKTLDKTEHLLYFFDDTGYFLRSPDEDAIYVRIERKYSRKQIDELLND